MDEDMAFAMVEKLSMSYMRFVLIVNQSWINGQVYGSKKNSVLYTQLFFRGNLFFRVWAIFAIHRFLFSRI